MKKLLIFSKNKNIFFNRDIITGGQKYDSKLVSCLKKYFVGDINYEDEQTYYITGNKLTKICGYINSVENITKYDYVIINSTNFKFLVILKKIHKFNPECKVIIIQHHFEYLAQSYINPKRYLLKIAEKYMLGNSDFIITPNQYSYNIAVDKLNIDKSKMYKIENSFNKNKKYELTKYKKGFLLYVGTIEYRKGIHILIQALAEIKELNFHMHFVGKYSESNSYFVKLKRMILKSGLKDKITFYGRITDDELNELYKKAEVFVFPSLNEGYGLVILEAMAHGLPVIAFDNTAMPLTVIDQVNGFLVKNKDGKELAKRIKDLLSNEILVRKMGCNAIRTFNRTKDDKEIENKIKDFVNNVLI